MLLGLGLPAALASALLLPTAPLRLTSGHRKYSRASSPPVLCDTPPEGGWEAYEWWEDGQTCVEYADAKSGQTLLGVYNAFLSLRGARIAVSIVANDDVQTETRRTSRRASSDSLPARAWTPSAFFLNAQRFKANVLLALFGAMVPVAAFWATMTYAWGGEEHMLAPTQYAWIAAMTLGNGACVGEIREWEERCGASRGGRAEGEEGTGDPDERSLADVAV